MEGNERRNIEARLQLLREIQAMLDASVLLMQQYSTVVANSAQNNVSVATQTETQPDPVSEVKVKTEPDVVPSTSEYRSPSPVPSTSKQEIKPEELSDATDSDRVKTDADTEELRRRRLQKFTLDK